MITLLYKFALAMHIIHLCYAECSDRGKHDFSGAGLGMKGHEYQDAAWMASVGVDYLKVRFLCGGYLVKHTMCVNIRLH